MAAVSATLDQPFYSMTGDCHALTTAVISRDSNPHHHPAGHLCALGQAVRAIPPKRKLNMNTISKKTAAPVKPVKQDATTLLRADHQLVSELFAEYDKARSVTKKKQLVTQI